VQPGLGDDPDVQARIARILAANGGTRTGTGSKTLAALQ